MYLQVISGGASFVYEVLSLSCLVGCDACHDMCWVQLQLAGTDAVIPALCLTSSFLDVRFHTGLLAAIYCMPEDNSGVRFLKHPALKFLPAYSLCVILFFKLTMDQEICV